MSDRAARAGAKRATLDGIILGGALGNMVGGVGLAVAAYVTNSVLLLVLGTAALIVGTYIYEAQRELMRRRP